MKRNANLLALFVFSLAVVFLFNTNAAAQQLLINEVEADPGDQQNDSCQYIEVRGTPGTTIPANTYFVAIDSDSAFPGRFHVAVNLGGTTIGANGIVYINNLFGVPCPNRTPAAGTTVVTYNSPIRIGGGNINVGSESFAILQTSASIFAGFDGDQDDDGQLDFAVTYLDAVAFLIDPDQQYAYPNNAPLLGEAFNVNQPDAFTRFPNNNTPNSAAAYYYGELASSPVESTVYEAPLSPNFPAGGALTPGAPNVPGGPVTPTRTPFDFDGDGRADQAVFRNGNWFVNRSASGFLAAQWGSATDRIAPADYDGDGKTDFAVFRPGALGFFYILQSTDNSARQEQFGQTGDIPLGGDWDGDGKADLAVYRNGATAGAASFFYYRPSSVGGTAIVGLQWGVQGDIPVAADYDGDGKTDAAVFRNGSWIYRQSTDGALRAVSFGVAGDKLVPANYDGDTKADFAVYRNGVWYIQGSTAGFSAISFGAAGDVPVPADYNGDGRADVAIFRNGNWYALFSQTNQFFSIQFGQSGDIPIPAAYIQ